MDYKKLVKESGLRQNFIAEKLGVTGAMLSMFLNGKTNMSPDKIKILKKILKRSDSNDCN